jgi:integrase
MPKLNQQVPRYCLHEPTGQAYVRLEGRQIYLGRWSAAPAAPSRQEYDRTIQEWMAAGRRLAAPAHPITIAEVIVRFRQHARGYYRRPDGGPSSEVANFDQAIRPLIKLYSNIAAADFGPLKLEAVRNAMVTTGWARTTINHQVARLKMVFKWAVSRELIAAAVYQALATIPGLRMGRTEASEPEPVKPVPTEHVAAALPFLARPVAAMVQLQLLTGMRPGEVCMMRTADVDTTGKLWLYRPPRHKTQHHGHQRTIYLGPKAQEVIRPFLRPELLGYLFSPAEAAREQREKRSQARTTPAHLGNRPGTNCKRHPKRQPGERYNVDAYRRAIARACDQANPPPTTADFLAGEAAALARWQSEHRWHPHQLRHTAATELRRTHGLEAAQVILGHKTLTVTQIYAEKNVDAAMRIMAAIG